MVRRRAGLGFAVVAVVIVGFSLATRLFLAPGSDTGAAAQPTPFGHIVPPGAEITPPDSTATPVPVPSGAVVIDAARAQHLALGSLGAAVDASSVSAELSHAGELTSLGGAFRQWATDYPVWVIHATGTFHGSFDVNAARQYSSATVFVDGVTGSPMGLRLTGEITPTPTPTPTS